MEKALYASGSMFWSELSGSFSIGFHLLGQDTHCKRAVEPDFQLPLHPKADVSVGHGMIQAIGMSDDKTTGMYIYIFFFLFIYIIILN